MKELKIILAVTFIVSLVLFASGCLEETFIPDPSDPRLPKYSEDGNQVGGALVNDVAWKTDYEANFNYTKRSFFFTNYSSGDSITIHFDGIFTEGKSKDRPLRFVVVVKKIQLSGLEDLKTLERRSFNLDGITNYAVLDDGFRAIQDSIDYFYGGTGAITFTQVKPMIDLTFTDPNGEKYHPLIVAGNFRFHFDQPSIDVTMGRFDFRIADDYLTQR